MLFYRVCAVDLSSFSCFVTEFAELTDPFSLLFYRVCGVDLLNFPCYFTEFAELTDPTFLVNLQSFRS